MSLSALFLDQSNASAGPPEEAGDRLEAAIVRARRRLRIVTSLGDLAMTLAEAVHRRAVAEEAVAMEALAARQDDIVQTPDDEPAVPLQTVRSQIAPSGDQTRAASRGGSRGAGRAPALGAGALFTRLSDTIRQCLELEIRIDETLRALEAALFVARRPDARLTGETEQARQNVARDRVCGLVEAVIDEEATTRRQARELHTALRERLDTDEAYRDLAGHPALVMAGRLCRDLDLHPGPSRWPPPEPG